jgi:hypothetical protein
MSKTDAVTSHSTSIECQSNIVRGEEAQRQRCETAPTPDEEPSSLVKCSKCGIENRRDNGVAEKARSIEWLRSPDYFELNKHHGRNDRLLHALFCAYVKHHFYEDDHIGWDELDNILFNALTNEIGDEEFCKWIDEVK